MRDRSEERSAAVARRLEQLRVELGDRARAEQADDATPPRLWRDQNEEHTRIRGFAPINAAVPASMPLRPGRHAARRRGLGRWVPVQGSARLGPAHLSVVAVLAALALAITCWWVIRDDPGEVVAGSAEVALRPTAAPGSASGTASASASGALVIDVSGRVRRPGIVVLPAGSRVVDALKKAGGARRGVDLSGLNLARPVIDGEQILVGVAPVPGVAASAAGEPRAPGAPPGLVSLNAATLEQLDTLPGVGPVTAQAILDWRTANGGFRSVDQLLEVDGIGEKTLAELAPLVTL